MTARLGLYGYGGPLQAYRHVDATPVRGTAQKSPYFTGLEWGLMRLYAGTYSAWDVHAEAVAYYGRPGTAVDEAVDGYLDAQDDSGDMAEVASESAANCAVLFYFDGLDAGLIDLHQSVWDPAVDDCGDPCCERCDGYRDAAPDPAGDP